MWMCGCVDVWVRPAGSGDNLRKQNYNFYKCNFCKLQSSRCIFIIASLTWEWDHVVFTGWRETWEDVWLMNIQHVFLLHLQMLQSHTTHPCVALSDALAWLTGCILIYLKNDCPLILFNSPESVHPGATGPNPRLSPRSLWHLTCLLHGDEFELRSKWIRITGKWSSAQVHLWPNKDNWFLLWRLKRSNL